MEKVHGFPIVDDNDRLIGLIGREQLIVLLKHKCWYQFDPNSYAMSNYFGLNNRMTPGKSESS